jgi:outer membrane protein OmpA-like peptidoglycan-associated protein
MTNALKNSYRITITVILLLNIQNLFAQNTKTYFSHPQMGRVTLAIDGGGAIGYTDYKTSNLDLIWRGSADYYFNTYSRHLVGLGLFAGTGNLNGNDLTKRPLPTDFKTSLVFYGGGLTYGYLVGDALFPTLFVGVSNLHFDPKDINDNPLVNNQNGVYSKNVVNLNLELGLRYLITEDIGVKVTFGTAYNFNDNLDDIERGKKDDIFYVGYLGLIYTINARKDSDHDGIEDSRDLCPDTPAKVNVDGNGCPVDSDNDGVPDYLDQCDKTPKSVQVDSEGCPVDSDKDGVPDYLDKCPNTPSGAKVNSNGCVSDSDADGIPDYLDQCPDTPKAAKVDQDGCPIDSDGDGVPDYADRCPNTPEYALVDQLGCPIDTDGDGVPDYADHCPDTPYGEQVTRDGCSRNFQEYIFNSSELFSTGESSLLPDTYKELDNVVSKINSQYGSKWRIEGHTNNQGDPEYNKVLSLQRAQSVYNYLIAQGLRKDRFEVVGLGEDFPIADNNTPQGQRINDRIVLQRIN